MIEFINYLKRREIFCITSNILRKNGTFESTTNRATCFDQGIQMVSLFIKEIQRRKHLSSNFGTLQFLFIQF